MYFLVADINEKHNLCDFTVFYTFSRRANIWNSVWNSVKGNSLSLPLYDICIMSHRYCSICNADSKFNLFPSGGLTSLLCVLLHPYSLTVWTYSRSCAWSRPGQRWSTRLVSHRRWRCCFSGADRVMLNRCPTETLLWGPPHRWANGTHPEPPVGGGGTRMNGR